MVVESTILRQLRACRDQNVGVWSAPLDLPWSSEFGQADWFRDRLRPFGDGVGSVVPEGFRSYLAIENPSRVHQMRGETLTRLAHVLGAHTTTPDDVWYCIWEGYGQLQGGAATSALRVGATVSERSPGLVPPAIRNGGRVRFPNRDYYLYRGAMNGATALAPWAAPNLWWPNDRAWFVASEIDLVVTYVGGNSELVAALALDSAFTSFGVATTERFERGRDYD